MMADISSETLKIRREQDYIFKVVKEKINCQVKVLYPAKLSFKNESEIQIFLNKQKLREVTASRNSMQKEKKNTMSFFRLKGNCNRNLYERIKSARNGECVGIYYLISYLTF